MNELYKFETLLMVTYLQKNKHIFERLFFFKRFYRL